MTILYSWDYDEEFEPAQSYIWSVYYLDLDAHNINLGNNIGVSLVAISEYATKWSFI